MPSFLSTRSSVGIPVVPRAFQPLVLASSAPSLFDSSSVPSTSSPTLAPWRLQSVVLAPDYAGKLVAKITSGAFVELADLPAENIRAQEAEPHTNLDGKLLVAPAKRKGDRDHHQRTLSDCFGSFPVGSSVICKEGGILFGQYSSGRGVVVRYITRFELDCAALSPLPVGGPVLLCVYCSTRSWKIKCHS